MKIKEEASQEVRSVIQDIQYLEALDIVSVVAVVLQDVDSMENSIGTEEFRRATVDIDVAGIYIVLHDIGMTRADWSDRLQERLAYWLDTPLECEFPLSIEAAAQVETIAGEVDADPDVTHGERHDEIWHRLPEVVRRDIEAAFSRWLWSERMGDEVRDDLETRLYEWIGDTISALDEQLQSIRDREAVLVSISTADVFIQGTDLEDLERRLYAPGTTGDEHLERVDRRNQGLSDFEAWLVPAGIEFEIGDRAHVERWGRYEGRYALIAYEPAA